MATNPDPKAPPGGAAPDTRCLVRTVAEAMRSDPALEAIKVDRKKRVVSVATLGKTRRPGLAHELTARIQELEAEESEASCALIDGASDCAACQEAPGLPAQPRLDIQKEPDITTIARVTCPTAPRFWRWHDVPWPRLVPRQVLLPDEAEHEREWKQQLLAATMCGACGIGGALLQDAGASLISFAFAYIFGAWFAFHEVWERLQKGVLDVHFLMLAVAFGSGAIGAWGEGAVLLFLFSLSSALEHYAMGRTQREIRALFRTAPKTATVIGLDGQETAVPVDQLRPGMRLLIKPGEAVPVDAEIVKGQTASDESNLTGEAVPVEKGVGDALLSGTLNLWGGVEAIVLRPASESSLQKVIRLIQQAQHLKSPTQRFTDWFGTRYTYAVLTLTLGMFFVWWLIEGHAPLVATPGDRSAFYRSMTLLVVASPCALVLSIPSAILAAIAWGARRGILFRGGAAIEGLAEADIVAMDKTGTLTTGELQIESVESYPPGREREVAELAYSLERLSSHPLARAIIRYGKQHGLEPRDVHQFTSVTGAGLEAQLDSSRIRLGRREWLAAGDHAATIEAVPPAQTGHSEIWLTCDGLAGRILLRDDLRPQARDLVLELERLGLPVLVLTGDRHGAAEALKTQLAVQEVRSQLRPEQKVETIYALTRQGRRVVMIGDGVNDAPSLAAAHVGVAMGARGSDAALEQAAVVLMHDRLERFLAALRLSHRARRVIRQNLVISLGSVTVLVSLALFEQIPLTLGVVGHEGSTVVVVLNSLRLLLWPRLRG